MSNWGRLLSWKGSVTLAPVLQIVQAIRENYCCCLYLSIGQVCWEWVVVQNKFSKMHPVLCTNTHHDVTDLVNHGMVKNTKTWISWKRNIIFLRNKKILNLCLRWHILKSYRFLAGVTFNDFLFATKYVTVSLLLPVQLFHIFSNFKQ